MRTFGQAVVYILWGFFALIVVLALYALGRVLRTGLEESEWEDTE